MRKLKSLWNRQSALEAYRVESLKNLCSRNALGVDVRGCVYVYSIEEGHGYRIEPKFDQEEA